ncbi:response regulator transcription factor [Paenibacillus athensensis]|uniref:DNA-binding response regulator n=1 Tax=Paenibacillus athensensis TaxID=1967502 RepID=A0A4Y8PZ90_9BACL|nr:response regulator transcription factor [Paenibacillus athensensis]MCD1260470.1 response regulator transcription factor [Paenibacillus athensensis]
MSKISIVIAEDQTLVRDGLTALIGLEDDMEVVGVCGNGEDAYNLVRQWRPRIVLMDIQMPVMDGIAATRLIKRDFPETLVLILTTFSEDRYIVEGLVHGASGYLLKDLPAAKLIAVLRDADRGELLLTSTIAAKLAGRLQQLSAVAPFAPSPLEAEFTPREIEVIERLVERKSNREIAAELYITEGTVKNYISVIYEKLGTNERLKAIALLKAMLQQAGHR